MGIETCVRNEPPLYDIMENTKFVYTIIITIWIFYENARFHIFGISK